MGSKTEIAWTDATWNPVRGCSRISPGCENCYAETMAARFSAPGAWAHGFALQRPARWTRMVRLVHGMLGLPLTWKKPRRIFVNDPAGFSTLATVQIKLRDAKGGDPAEWPADLRVREFPEAAP